VNWLIALIAGLLLLAASCDLAKDTADETEATGQGAVGIAEKMSGGTVGDADMDTGESPSADEEDHDDAEEDIEE
jgi:hypothetical protein